MIFRVRASSTAARATFDVTRQHTSINQIGKGGCFISFTKFVLRPLGGLIVIGVICRVLGGLSFAVLRFRLFFRSLNGRSRSAIFQRPAKGATQSYTNSADAPFD